MSSMLSKDFLKSWTRFIQDLVLAKNYPQIYRLQGASLRNPFLEKFLPSFFYIRSVVLLDDALKKYIQHFGLKINKPNPRLHDRLECLKDKLKNFHALDKRIRKFRNDLAHEVLEFESWADWTQLETDLDIIEDELKHLGFVGDRPQYEAMAERSAVQGGTEPGVLHFRDYEYGIKDKDGKWVIHATYRENTMRSSE